MELYLRYDRLAIWPKRSLSKLLKAERAYFHAHRPELTELVQAGLQPRLPDEPVAPTAPPPCPYCMRPCVGQENGWYLIYHGNDPQEIRRRQEARAQRDAFDRATWHLHNEVQW